MKVEPTAAFWLWVLLVLTSLWGTSERNFVASEPIPGRPTVRQASVWARGVAKNAKTVLLERRTSKLARLTLLGGLIMPGIGIGLPGTPRRLLLFVSLLFFALVKGIRTRRPYVRPPLNGQYRQMGLHSFTDATAREFLGFDSTALLQRAFNAWHVPAVIRVGDNANDAKNFNMPGVVVMLVVLNRLKVDSKLTTMEAFWGMDYTVISRIVKAGMKWFVATQGHRLVDTTIFLQHFPRYNQAIINKHNLRFAHIHAQHQAPPELADTCAFYDRTNVPICRPGPDWFAQAQVFNHHAWDHVLGASAAVAPDGIFIHFYTGVVSGRHSDQHFLNMSGLDQHLTNIQLGQQRQYHFYADKGYGNFMINIFSAYHGLNVTLQQTIWNYMMSPLRVTVEWGFGKLKATFPALARRVMMKSQLSPTNLYLKASALLCNTHTMLHGSNVGRYFGLDAQVTVEQYFA